MWRVNRAGNWCVDAFHLRACFLDLSQRVVLSPPFSLLFFLFLLLFPFLCFVHSFFLSSLLSPCPPSPLALSSSDPNLMSVLRGQALAHVDLFACSSSPFLSPPCHFLSLPHSLSLPLSPSLSPFFFPPLFHSNPSLSYSLKSPNPRSLSHFLSRALPSFALSLLHSPDVLKIINVKHTCTVHIRVRFSFVFTYYW